MTDFFEIDFLAVESGKSGDAIAIRYSVAGRQTVQVVDGGFTETGRSLVSHINKYYGPGAAIDYVVLTHPDNDHAIGLQQVLLNFEVRFLIMNRPWAYAEELLPRTRYQTAEALAQTLRDKFPYSAELEEIALTKGIPIYDGLQGLKFGEFKIVAPTRDRYVELVLEASGVSYASLEAIASDRAAAREPSEVQAGWGDERFSGSGTGPRNEMSIVQVATIAGSKIMLTGDAGRDGLAEAVAYAPTVGFGLPGINIFQVPHHGSRRNVTTELLNSLLGPILRGPAQSPVFQSYISSAKADEHHPRKSVIRAMHHRGGSVACTEGTSLRAQRGAPKRDGYRSAVLTGYPLTQEVD